MTDNVAPFRVLHDKLGRPYIAGDKQAAQRASQKSMNRSGKNRHRSMHVRSSSFAMSGVELVELAVDVLHLHKQHPGILPTLCRQFGYKEESGWACAAAIARRLRELYGLDEIPAPVPHDQPRQFQRMKAVTEELERQQKQGDSLSPAESRELWEKCLNLHAMLMDMQDLIAVKAEKFFGSESSSVKYKAMKAEVERITSEVLAL